MLRDREAGWSLPLARILIMAELYCVLPSLAGAIVGDRDGNFGLDAALRHTTSISRNYSQPILFGLNNNSDSLSETRLRLIFGGRPTEAFSYSIHLLQGLSSGTGLITNIAALSPAPGSVKYRAFDWKRDWLKEDDLSAVIDVDKFQIRIKLPLMDITLGRQTMTFGKTYFWNPLDLYFPFGSVQFDRDYKPGVDGLRLDIPFGQFSGLTLVGIMGAGPAASRGTRSSLLARTFANFSGWDVSIQAGRVEEGLHASTALAGEIAMIEIRLAASYFRPQESGSSFDMSGTPEHSTVVLGLGKSFESSLSFQFEGLYNSAGREPLDQALALAASGQILQAGRWILGSSVNYELSPLWQSSLAWIRSFSDGSQVVQPGLSYSLSSEVDLVFGALIALGRRPISAGPFQLEPQSEFGMNPHLFYLETKAYF